MGKVLGMFSTNPPEINFEAHRAQCSLFRLRTILTKESLLFQPAVVDFMLNIEEVAELRRIRIRTHPFNLWEPKLRNKSIALIFLTKNYLLGSIVQCF